MVEDGEENDLVLPPGLFGRASGDAGLRAAAVFFVGYLLPVAVLGRTAFSNGIQWVALLLVYFLTSLAIFRFLEARVAAEDVSDGLVVGGGSVTSVGALDEVVASAGTGSSAHKPHAWSSDLLHQLDWKRLVDLCLAYFSDRFQCKASSLAEDGSVEIKLFKAPAERPVAIVYCRAWGAHEVGLDALENLSVQMAQELIAKGFCISYGGFTAEAKDFAKNHAITLIDDAMFISMLSRLSEERKQQLLSLAVEADYAVPTCPVCGLKMIARQSEQARYWGCRAYPRCKGVLAMRPKRHDHPAAATSRVS